MGINVASMQRATAEYPRMRLCKRVEVPMSLRTARPQRRGTRDIVLRHTVHHYITTVSYTYNAVLLFQIVKRVIDQIAACFWDSRDSCLICETDRPPLRSCGLSSYLGMPSLHHRSRKTAAKKTV